MDAEMLDLDLVLDSDPIHDFLRKKLEEIQHANTKLEKQIEEKEKLLEECLNMTSDTTNNCLHIVEHWKRIHNNKCVIGIRLKNSGIESVTVENIILNWNSSSLITYKTKIFDLDFGNNQETLNKFPEDCKEIKNEAVLLLVIDKCGFSKILHEADGIILYKNNLLENRQLGLSNLQIGIHDFLDPTLETTVENVINRESKSVLTYLVSMETYRVVAKVPHNQKFHGHLRTQCRYHEIFSNSTNYKYIFLINNLTHTINGSLIETSENEDDTFEVKIMCLNEDVLFKILHHIYSKIDGLYIVPKSHEICLHQLQLSEDSDGNDINMEKFAEILQKQLVFIKNFCSGKVKQCSWENYLCFRSQMNDLQLETDLLYLKCCNNV